MVLYFTLYTDYVSTWWHLAAEILIIFPQYIGSIDYFMMGCIILELLPPTKFLSIRNDSTYIGNIVSVLGRPDYNENILGGGRNMRWQYLERLFQNISCLVAIGESMFFHPWTTILKLKRKNDLNWVVLSCIKLHYGIYFRAIVTTVFYLMVYKGSILNAEKGIQFIMTCILLVWLHLIICLQWYKKYNRFLFFIYWSQKLRLFILYCQMVSYYNLNI